MVGLKCNKLLLYSSASTTNVSPAPKIELESNDLITPPTIIVGSKFIDFKIVPTIDVVVVFP